MAKVESYKCDVCGKQKGDVNHWFVVVSATSFLAIRPWPKEPNDAMTFDGTAHLCGAECVQKMVSQFLAPVTVAPKGDLVAEASR